MLGVFEAIRRLLREQEIKQKQRTTNTNNALKHTYDDQEHAYGSLRYYSVDGLQDEQDESS